MATFVDDFERANGALGGNWVSDQGSATITGGTVGWTLGAWMVHNTTVSDSDYVECRAHVYYTGSTTAYAGPAVKAAGSPAGCYFARIFTVSSSVYLQLVRRDGSVNTVLAQSSALGTIPPYIYLSIVFDHGHLTATYGATSVEADDSTYASNPYGGITGNAAGNSIADCQIVAQTAVSLSVSPELIGNYGSTTALTFTGTGTAWTPGTPGSPTFTCDHGTLSSQTVSAADSATATYDPGSYLGTVIFTDPSTGATDTCLVTSDIGVLPPGTVDPWLEDNGAMVHATVANWTPNPILNAGTLISASGAPELNVDIVTAIGEIWAGMFHFGLISRPEGAIDRLNEVWRGLNGTLIYDGTTYVPDNPGSVKEDTDVLRTSLAALRTTGEYTLTDVIVALQGTPSVTLAQLAEAIDAISAPDLSAILDAIAAVRGTGNPDLAAVMTAIAQIRTGGLYDLGDVMEAIAGVGTVDLSTITAKLNAIQPSETYTLSSITTEASGANTAAQAAVTALGVLTGDGELTLQTIIDAINALELPTAASAGAPVWPGSANVTLGTPVALTNGMTITDDMDGVIVAVTTPPTRTGLYQIGSESYDYGVGRIAFESDGGELEPWQYLGFRAALFTPKSMRRASKVHLQVLGGAEGTVTPWITSE